MVLPLLAKRLILSFSLQNRSLREESRQEAVKVETQTAPDAEMGWSRRRHASRQSSDGVRHTTTIRTYPRLDQDPAKNFICQSHAASRRENQSAACHSLTKHM